MVKTTVIRPFDNLLHVDLRELWENRELFSTLMFRDIKLKYKQTAVGILWAVMQPFTQMIVFSFFFGKLAKIPSDNVPYPLFSFSGLILWTMFATALTNASNSMINSTHLITKVYFPRLIIPTASTLVAYLDYVIAWLVLGILFMIYNWQINWFMILSPLVAFLVLIFSNGLGMILAAINVTFRDVRFVLPFVIQMLLFISPVIYPVSVAGQFEWFVKLNPMSGYLELHRALILGHQNISLMSIFYSIAVTIVSLLIGIIYFNWQQRKFVDII